MTHVMTSMPNGVKSYGAGCRIRTRDPLITNQVLYQLSYKGDRTGASRAFRAEHTFAGWSPQAA